MATSELSPGPDGTDGGEVVVGWLHVWDLESDDERQQGHHGQQGQQPLTRKAHKLEPEWQPKFCELFCDERTLTFRDSEHDEDDSTSSAPETKESTPVGSQSPQEPENTQTTTSIGIATVIVETPDLKTQRIDTPSLKRRVGISKSKPISGSNTKIEVRRSNSVPNAPNIDLFEHVTRSLRLRRKISLTDKPSSKAGGKSEKKIQRPFTFKVGSTLKGASRKLEKQLENQEIRESIPQKVVSSLIHNTSSAIPDLTDNPKLELFLPVPEDSTTDPESGLSSPSQDTTSDFPEKLSGISAATSSENSIEPTGNPSPAPVNQLRTVPPIIISAATVAATCVQLVRVRTRLDGGRDHFDTRWGYKARRRAAAKRAALEKERQEREERERRERDGEDSSSRHEESVISEDDSSLEHVDEGRRGSLPLVSSPYGDSMESVSTTSKLANFFSKKGFKTNLKRTKSATKLDRKRSSPNLSERDASSLMGSLRRSLSLGKLNKKKQGRNGKEGESVPRAASGDASCLAAESDAVSATAVSGAEGDCVFKTGTDNFRPAPSDSAQSSPALGRRAAGPVRSTPLLLGDDSVGSSSLSLPRNQKLHGIKALSLFNARIRSSRSHESLLSTSSPPSMHSIDLSAPGVEVKPLHSSVLGQGHCFEVDTPQGKKFISCTTSEERDKWLYSLRRTIRPNEEHCKRSDSSLKLWIVEAKNVPAKKSYFCEILLDRHLYAQTSVKTMTEMLFWGEHFEFKNLPAVETITINLYREPDKKKKNKDKSLLLVGYIRMNLMELKNRELVEKWITCNSGTVGKAGKEQKSDLPIIRVKSRRQTVEILPLDTYQSFIQYLTLDYRDLCRVLEQLLAVREKEDFATSLVHILQKQGKAITFLSDIVMEEISRLDDEHLTFRGNSIATKAMEAYMKLVGEKYLQDTLGEFIRDLIKSTDDCEVDPAKVATPQLLSCQQKNLEMYSNMAWVKIINSFCYFPNEMREVFASLRSRCTDRNKADYSENLISGCIFLRFLCPAILNPSLFKLTQEYPHERAARNLTLIAKTIQTLANFTQFGGKEEFMTFMNSFVEREAPNMKGFLHRISGGDAGNQFLEYDGCIDLGKELSVLHCLLVECKKKYPDQTSKPEYEKLSNILTSLNNALEDPTVGQKKPTTGSSGSNTTSSNTGGGGSSSNSSSNRRSQIYDNLMHIINTSSTTSTSNTASNSTSSKPLETGGRGVIPPSRIGYVIPTARSNNSSKMSSSSANTPSSHQSVAMTASSPTEVLIDMLRQCGESAEELPALSERCRQLENERSRTGTPTTTLSSSNASLNSVGRKGSGVPVVSTSSTSGTGTPSVASLVNKLNNATATLTRTEERFAMKNSSGSRNISLNAVPPAPQHQRVGTTGRVGRRRSSQEESRGEVDVTVKDSWSHIPGDTSSSITSTDGPYHPHGDYIDLIPFVDDMAGQATLEGNSSGSQISIGPISTAASSGYHSLGRPGYNSQTPSQADSPVISGGPRQSPVSSGHGWSSNQQARQQQQQQQQQQEMTRELARSPIIHYQPPQQPTSQPLAFANPLFRHQQQQHQDREELTHHRGMAVSHAHAVQRVSSDSSLSSNDETDATASGLGRSAVSSSHRRGSNGTGGDNKPAQSSAVASLKKLSQLPTSSSEDSLDEGGGGGGGDGRSAKSSVTAKQETPSQSRNYHHQYRQYSTPAADSTTLSSSAISGCSTFPRRHHRNNASNSSGGNASTTNASNTGTLKKGRSSNSNKSEVSPPLPPREAISARTAWKPASANVPGLDFQRQVSSPGPNIGIAGGQATRNFHNRARLTTNKAGYVQQRASPRQGPGANPSDSSSNPTGSLSRTYKNSSSSASGGGSSNKGAGKSPTSQRRLLTSSIVSSLASSAEASAANSTAPPGWQMAQRVKRGSNSSQGTATESSSSGNNNSSSSNSEASSPQSMMRSSSAQQTTTSGSMQESSSAHSLGQSWGSLGPDETPTTNTVSPFPPRSDSVGSLSSLPRGHQQAKGWSQVPHSESSGSLTGRSSTQGQVETEKSSIHSSGSSGNVNSKNTSSEQQQNHTNNNVDGTSESSTTLDNRGTGGSQPRLPTLTDSTSSIPQPPAFLTSKYAVVHPNTAHASPPSSSATLTTGGMPLSSSSSSKPNAANHNLDLDILKRASTDSILSIVSGGGGQAASPTGSAPGIPREDSSQSICSSTGSTASGGNRRLSPQSTVHMGISSVQRKLQEQERTKLEYEQEVHVLRQQLLEAQGRLQTAEVRLLDHELETHRLMDEWRSRLAESQEQMRRQQQEKDGQMVSFMQRLQNIEEDLKREQAEMASAVEHKQQVIEAQEQRIKRLDQANARLLQALAELRGQAARGGEDSAGTVGVLVDTAACNGRQEVTGFKTSSC